MPEPLELRKGPATATTEPVSYAPPASAEASETGPKLATAPEAAAETPLSCATEESVPTELDELDAAWAAMVRPVSPTLLPPVSPLPADQQPTESLYAEGALEPTWRSPARAQSQSLQPPAIVPCPQESAPVEASPDWTALEGDLTVPDHSDEAAWVDAALPVPPSLSQAESAPDQPPVFSMDGRSTTIEATATSDGPASESDPLDKGPDCSRVQAPFAVPVSPEPVRPRRRGSPPMAVMMQRLCTSEV